MTIEERIHELIEQHGSLRAAARAMQVDAGYLSRLAMGAKSSPGDDLLRRMGLCNGVTHYKRMKD